MKVTKKLFSGVLSTALILAVLTACSSTEGSSPQTEREANTEVFDRSVPLPLLRADPQHKADRQLERMFQRNLERITNVSNSTALADLIHYDENGRQEKQVIDLARMLRSELVIIGEFVEETQESQGLNTNPLAIRPGSFGRLRVTDVFQGDVKVGDEITIYAPYALNTETGVLQTWCDVMPMNKGDRWLYFLRNFENAFDFFEEIENKTGMEIAEKEPVYQVARANSSRFPVPTEQVVEVVSEVRRELAFFQNHKMEILERAGTRVENSVAEECEDSRYTYVREWENGSEQPPTVYRVTHKEAGEISRFWYDNSERLTNFYMDAETSAALGRYSSATFEFDLYAEILEHFQIKTVEQWQKPRTTFQHEVD
jgi:hypothetical protein